MSLVTMTQSIKPSSNSNVWKLFLGQVLYKHEDQTVLKLLDKTKTSVSLPQPKDNGYVVLEIRSWGEGGDGPAHEIIVSRDSGEKQAKCVSKKPASLMF